MRIKAIVAEDFINYKLPSMFISTCFCDYKCCTELGIDIGVCQNAPLSQMQTYEISNEVIYNNFINNPITKAIVIGGLEPMIQFNELLELIKYFRERENLAPFIIYTGYYEEEIKDKINVLKNYKNIIIKFGRFIPNKKSKYDEILGINLVSDNQYGKQIS